MQFTIDDDYSGEHKGWKSPNPWQKSIISKSERKKRTTKKKQAAKQRRKNRK